MGKETKKKSDKPVEHEAEPAQPEKAHGASFKDRLRSYWRWILTHKKVSIPIAAALLLAVLAAVPFTRYTIAGLIIKHDFSVVIVDTETGKPISSATVDLQGKTAQTDAEGRATVKAKVGYSMLSISKKYYEASEQRVLVPIKKPTSALEVKLKATGRAVPVTVVNKISKKPVEGVTIKAEGGEAKTDDKGQAVVVVPAEAKDVKVSLTGDGFNNADAVLTVTSDEVAANTFEVTPSGKIYFLSNASGKIDLVKSNLDGADRQTVLAGTGKEDRYNTVLIASRDWKYIALLSKRDGGEYAKLFLIETADDKLTTMDEGEATFDVYGWSDDRFIYKVNREKKKYWEPGREAIKSYHVPVKRITTLHETSAEGSSSGYIYEEFGSIFILGQEISYLKNWSWGSNAYALWQGKQATFNTVQADGSRKKVVKSYSDHSISALAASFGEIYIRYLENENDDNTAKVDEYRDGKITVSDEDPDNFYNESYDFYSVSPSGNKTLWSEYRDGKNVFLVGDDKGENGKEIGRTDTYSTYGWFTDNYVLLTKKGSEMHILPTDGLEGGIEKAFKISDYYKPNYNNRGFGYGYGG